MSKARSNLKLLTDRLKNRGQGRPNHPVHHFAGRDGFLYIPVNLIRANPDQPRKHFDAEALRDLTTSVKEKGILQPILVRPDPEGEGFILIAGERRWRAAKAATIAEIPALVRKQEDSLEVAIIENMQREDIHPLELAEALLKAKQYKNYTDAELARVIGTSRKSVNETLLLNQLSDEIKAEWRTSATASKSQILQILRAGSPEKIAAAWDALKSGAVTTVRELRKQKQATKKGRPQHFRFEHHPKNSALTVTVTATKQSASRAELRAALKDALQHLP